ncbi:DBX2 isoform 2 [Pongo abelii]|uniref:DBX2 isoform 2 n=1 Tax=Pongo abelii TaxID=9601 RepID=A0A2J8WCN0_PONAB|nr:DBX2 isoform 2 [Pongo abelii]
MEEQGRVSLDSIVEVQFLVELFTFQTFSSERPAILLGMLRWVLSAPCILRCFSKRRERAASPDTGL